MRVLILNYEFPPLGGGAGRVALSQAQILAKKHEVVVLTAGFDNLPDFEEMDGFEVFRLKSRRRYCHKSNVFEMMSWLKYAKIFCNDYLVSNPIHLVIAHFSLPGGELAFRLSKKFNIPYFVISHGHDIPWFFPKQMWHFHLITYFRIRKICRNASKLIVLSEILKQNAIQFLGDKYQNIVHVIPNATKEDEFPLIIDRDRSELKILFIGRLVEQKNPLLLIKALKELKNKGILFSCNIIGDGPLYSVLQKNIRDFELENQIQLRGWLEKKEIVEAMKQAHLFVLPSRIEAMSVAILEALFSGLFVITTPEADSFKLINADIGAYFENNNVADLLKTILDFHQQFILNEKLFPIESYHKIRHEFGMMNFEKRLTQIIAD